MSVKPGVTSAPSALTSRRPRPSLSPTCVMMPPVMPTSAVRGGPPFPSATVPPLITRSKALTLGVLSAVLKRDARLVGRFGPSFLRVGDDEFAGLEAAFGGHGGQLGAERLGRGRRRRAPAGQRRGDGGDHAGRDGEPEGHPETAVERRGDQVREELPPGQVGGVGRGQLMEQRTEQLLYRVVAEEGGEQHADRGKVRDRRGRGGR